MTCDLDIFKTNDFYILYLKKPNQIPEIKKVVFNYRVLENQIREIINLTTIETDHNQPFGEIVNLNPKFREFAFQVFDEILALQKRDQALAVGVADYFFNATCDLYWKLIVNRGSKNLARTFLEKICLMVDDWERGNKRVHKGTPYYFLTFIYRELGDIDSAFASAFKAIQEDIDSKIPILGTSAYKDSPAYKYVSIVDDKENYLINVVLELRGMLQEYINEYNTLALSKIQILDLDTKLFRGNVEDIGHFFVYTLECVKKYFEQIPTLPKNDFYEMKNTRDIFNLCLITDKLLESKYIIDFMKNIPRKANGSPERDMYIRDGIALLFDSKYGVTLTSAQKRDPKGSLTITPLLPEDPQGLVDSLFLKPISYNINGIVANSEMRIMLLALGLRNIGAHEMGRHNVFVSEYDAIVKWLIFSVFIAASVL